jgi:hypothetical protein
MQSEAVACAPPAKPQYLIQRHLVNEPFHGTGVVEAKLVCDHESTEVGLW